MMCDGPNPTAGARLIPWWQVGAGDTACGVRLPGPFSFLIGAVVGYMAVELWREYRTRAEIGRIMRREAAKGQDILDRERGS